MGEENFQIVGAAGTALFFCFRPLSLVLPPSDEGGGKPGGFDGGRDTAGLRKVRCPEDTGCEFSPSVACGDSSLVRGSQGAGVQEKTSSKRANGGFRGAFRPWYKGPPAAFLSTFRRWKVDDFPAKQVLRGPRFI